MKRITARTETAMYDARYAAQRFVSFSVHDEGPEGLRLKAVQGVLDAAGFDAVATCWPVFGGMWLRPCKGPDGPEATEWLQSLTDTLPLGRKAEKAAHVEAAVLGRTAVA